MATVKSSARDKPRHSANFGQGAAKKGGAGGRGAWGAPEQDYKFVDEDMHALDAHDPNFDEELDDNTGIEWASFEPTEASFKKTILSAAQFKHKVHKAVSAFLINYEHDDFIRSLNELECLEMHHEVVKIAINVSLDGTDEARRAVSALLKRLHSDALITPEQSVFAFRRLYNRLPDLVLDVPNARTLLNEFARRAALAGWLDTDTADALRVTAEAYEHSDETVEAKRAFEELLDEYFSHGDVADAAAVLRDLDLKHLHREFVKLALLRGLDRHNRERELVSLLLAEDELISREDAESGFEILLDRVDDLHRDCPDVLRLLSSFLARAVVDEVVSPAFVARSRCGHVAEQGSADGGSGASVDSADEFYSGDVLRAASSLLAMPHAGARLASLWGPNSYDALKHAVADLADEYLDTDDVAEALRCLRELQAPAFRHELVKRVFVLAVDRQPRHRARAEALVLALAVQPGGADQVRIGLHRLRDALDDLAKDAPAAPDALQHLVDTLEAAGVPLQHELHA